MVPARDLGPRLSGCRGPAAPSCSLQMQTRSPFLEGKNGITKGKIILSDLNQIWNQRLQNDTNSSFARKNANETVFQKVGVDGLEQNHFPAERPDTLPCPALPSSPLWTMRLSRPSRSTQPGSLGHLSDCDRVTGPRLTHHPRWTNWPLVTLRNQPFLTCQSQGVVPPTGC